MQKLEGRLQYMGWFNLPWKLVTDHGEIDLWPIIDKFFISLNGKRAKHDLERDGYTLAADESSEFQFKYVPGEYVLLEKPKGFGISNVHAYLDGALVWLSGRMVEIKIEDGKQIKLMADKTEEVYGVYFVDDGNSCEVPRGAEQNVCKIGQSDCCIFLTVCENGFRCEKFSGIMARDFLDRLAKRTIRASRIGNCVLIGRKEKIATM
jgi:hypothetical protein